MIWHCYYNDILKVITNMKLHLIASPIPILKSVVRIVSKSLAYLNSVYNVHQDRKAVLKVYPP